MSSAHKSIEELIEAHLNGEHVEIPSGQQEKFQHALAAHEALRKFLEETTTQILTPESDRIPPDLSQNYEIKKELGRGGMGVVYLAHQKSLDRDVALKVLRPGEQAADALLNRFRAEARHLASLRHPNIVSIHEVGEAHNEPYFTMDYIEGETLSSVIKRGPLSPSQAVQILEQVAQAIYHAHRQGIIHRDLKPGNVLLDKSRHVYVTDFGLARSITTDSNLTRTGELLGTPQYMAPEQARGENELIGETTDIYALGLLLFEMLTGHPAFSAASPADLIVKVLHEEAPPLRKLDRRIPRDLETICQKMLQKSSVARYANVSAVLEDLARYTSGEPLMARRPNPILRAARRFTRIWKPVAAVVLASVVVFGLSRVFFEKPYEELIAWGDEELATGDPQMAASVFKRAFVKSNESQRPEAISRMLQTMGLLEDSELTIDLAKVIMKEAPYQSFGKNDYLVAMALIADARSQSPNGSISIWAEHDRKEIEYLARRLRMGLANIQETTPQKQEAEKTLNALEIILGQSPRPSFTPPPDHATLPTGSNEELQQIVDDERAGLWTRGKAAFVLGRRFREQGKSQQASQMMMRAYEMMRQVYPTYTGVVDFGKKAKGVSPPDSSACQLIQDLIMEIRDSDPKLLDEPEGIVQFDVTGVPLSPGTSIHLKLELCASSIRNPNLGLQHNLPRLIPLHEGQPVRIGVLDGTYRLKKRGFQTSYAPQDAHLIPLLQVDLEGWPETIEMHGNTLQLPPVNIRVAEEIALVEPKDGERLDLNQAKLKWTQIKGTDHYQIQFLYSYEDPTPSDHYFVSIRTDEPSLFFSQLTGRERNAIAEHLTSGRTGGWRVNAIDHSGKIIGTTIEPRRFLVLRKLSSRK